MRPRRHSFSLPRTDAGQYVVRVDWTDATGERCTLILAGEQGKPRTFDSQADAWDYAMKWEYAQALQDR